MTQDNWKGFVSGEEYFEGNTSGRGGLDGRGWAASPRRPGKKGLRQPVREFRLILRFNA
jgi:hypothetical protein